MPAKSASSSAHSSPRTRRTSRPLPFTMSIPPPLSSFPQPNQDPFHCEYSSSRPASPGYYRNAVDEVQSVLYGGKGRDRDQIRRVVEELYDGGGTFENPLTYAKGREAIGDMFALLGLVPGTMWSELGDVTESQGYDGNRLMIFSHTLHISLLPFLDSEDVQPLALGTATPSLRRSYSFFSLPSTPYPETPSAAQPSHDPGADSPTFRGIFSKTHPAFSAQWPSHSLFSLLNPKTIASALTTLHLKLHTQLLFNEAGRIIRHEDLWGIKELLEGVFPIIGHLYAINRQGMGWLAGIASRKLLGRTKDSKGRGAEEATVGMDTSMQTPEGFGAGSRQLYRPPIDATRPLASNGLGLVAERAVPTTIEDVESGGE
ncbi:hypothetical protein JCM21900_002766 [Sporobolomyces salmonicolor]